MPLHKCFNLNINILISLFTTRVILNLEKNNS